MDAGAFEIAVRTTSGTRIEVTQGYVRAVENYTKEKLGGDLELVISEIGLTADWSAAFTQNAGPMDAVVKVQLKPERSRSAQEYVRILRDGFAREARFTQVPLEFSFDAGGMIRGALNEGKSSPINLQLVGKNRERMHFSTDVADVEIVVTTAPLHRYVSVFDDRVGATAFSDGRRRFLSTTSSGLGGTSSSADSAAARRRDGAC